MGDKCGRQVGDKCKLMRPKAPRVGDKCVGQVGDKCKLMRPRAPRVGDKCGRQMELDDGWPESVEEQSLVLLVWRHYITR